jgi:PilZ domain-containing protein
MNNPCELHALVVGRDVTMVDAILPSLRELGIAPSVYAQPDPALQMLTQEKVDALFIDRELDPELTVLKRMRNSPSNRGAVAFAIVAERKFPDNASSAADFVMDKPLAPVAVNRAVRAAFGMMLKQRKRYFRYPLRVPVCLTDSSYRRFVGETLNISKTGIAVECAAPWVAADTVQLEFELPRSSYKLSCRAQLIWLGEQGKAGLCFTHMNAADKRCLEDWIEEEFHRSLQMPALATRSKAARRMNPLNRRGMEPEHG